MHGYPFIKITDSVWLNENMNALVRQYFLKDRDFTTITEEEIEFLMSRLNNRPRKCLGFEAPFEVFFKHPFALSI